MLTTTALPKAIHINPQVIHSFIHTRRTPAFALGSSLPRGNLGSNPRPGSGCRSGYCSSGIRRLLRDARVLIGWLKPRQKLQEPHLAGNAFPPRIQTLLAAKRMSFGTLARKPEGPAAGWIVATQSDRHRTLHFSRARRSTPTVHLNYRVPGSYSPLPPVSTSGSGGAPVAIHTVRQNLWRIIFRYPRRTSLAP